MRFIPAALVAACLATPAGDARAADPAPPAGRALTMTRAEYEDRVHAGWHGQIIGVLLTLPYEHKVSSVRRLTAFPKKYTAALVDDDWYYEMVAVRGFEKHGPGMTVNQLGALWQAHNCGTWGSSKYAREAMARGVKPEDAGHPVHNRLWFTIGPMFSCELYGLIAPGDPNLAGRLARDLGRINGHAEGLDAGVFAAGLVSLAFREADPKEVVRGAAALVHPDSPTRQAIDLVVRSAESGKSFREVCDAVEDRWHVEYPATNNAVANGALLAACVWFGGGDFLESANLAASAGDFVDCDNIAATACAVVGAMKGMKAVPADLVKQLNDRIAGADMAGLIKLTPPVDETISGLARRTAAVGAAVLAANGAAVTDDKLSVPAAAVRTQPPQLFRLADLTRHWNRDWTLERAGFGGGDGGMGGIRGLTHLSGDTLATYPRDEVRSLVLRRSLKPEAGARLTFDAGVDPGRGWTLEVYLDNTVALSKRIEAPAGAKDRHWESVDVDLGPHAGSDVHVRLFQRVLTRGAPAGNAYWKNLRVGGPAPAGGAAAPGRAGQRPVAPWPPPAGPLRLVIDADAANEVDDPWAMALALGFPERLRIEGFVAAHYGLRGGSKGIQKSYDSILATLAAAGAADRFHVKKGSDPLVYRDRVPGANDRVAMGVIGCGGRGRFVIKQLLDQGADFAVPCDPDRVGKAQEQLPAKPRRRRTSAGHAAATAWTRLSSPTPDHRHALPFAAAVQAGRDAYVKKPTRTSS